MPRHRPHRTLLSNDCIANINIFVVSHSHDAGPLRMPIEYMINFCQCDSGGLPKSCQDPMAGKAAMNRPQVMHSRRKLAVPTRTTILRSLFMCSVCMTLLFMADPPGMSSEETGQ